MSIRAFFNFGIKRSYLTENPVSRSDFAEVDLNRPISAATVASGVRRSFRASMGAI
jgi:hypothetical protein